jgi:DNA-binding NarL/FixJ family response regulator
MFLPPVGCDNPAMPRRVLIVDDHAGFRVQARALLASHGYDIVGEAADGAQALACTAVLRPEIVLLDVNLPDVSGFDIADDLRRAGGSTVVMMSGRDPSVSRRRRERAQLPFIFKPDLCAETLEGSLVDGARS